ncbi:MAG: serine--tRNA ligase, partial [Candidatus Krumholzibacteria bacterium]|nr:serine--tRNA ligase [Candidatus Krumholzibacteria bacterium]
MLDRKLIRKDVERVREGIRKKGVDFDLDHFLALDERMRELIKESETLKHERNVVSQEISRLKKEDKDAAELLESMRQTSGRIKDIEKELKDLSGELDGLSLVIPNIPHDSVPYGTCPDHNVEIRKWGELKDPAIQPRPHWEIGEELGILDLASASNLSGSGFIVLRNDGALMARALINLMLDVHRRQGYEEISVPYMVTRDCMIGTGQLPKLEDDMYICERDDLYLIPTAEVPITNIHRGAILEGDALPLKYTAFSPCFRREAGSYGQETRGLI